MLSTLISVTLAEQYSHNTNKNGRRWITSDETSFR